MSEGVAAIMGMRIALGTRRKNLIIDRHPSGASDFVGPAVFGGIWCLGDRRAVMIDE